MKKILSITVCTAMIFALTVVSYAQETDSSAQDFYQQVEGVVSTSDNSVNPQDAALSIPEDFPGDLMPGILYINGDETYEPDSETFDAANGIILQMIDDSVSDADKSQEQNGFVQEAAGFPAQIYAEPPASDAEDAENTEQNVVIGSRVCLNLTSGKFEGDIYNATGYYAQAPDILEVNISQDAQLEGDIALTSYVHGIMLGETKAQDLADKINEINGDAEPGIIEYVFMDSRGQVTDTAEDAYAVQFTRFPEGAKQISGSVINYINYNGRSEVQVNVNGTWKVRSAALITCLNIDEKALVYGEIIELADKSLLIIPSEETIKPGEYGTRS